MSRLYSVVRGRGLVLVAGSLVAFIVGLATGLGVESLAFLGAGIWWLLMSRYWAGRARAARRHRELRGRRREREREGRAPRRP